MPSAGPWAPWPPCPEAHQDPKPARAWQGTPCLPDKKEVSQSREDNPALTVPTPKYMCLLKADPGGRFSSHWLLQPFLYDPVGIKTDTPESPDCVNWGPLTCQEAWQTTVNRVHAVSCPLEEMRM